MARRSLLDFQSTRIFKQGTVTDRGVFTVDTGDDTILDAGHAMDPGDLVILRSDGVDLPEPFDTYGVAMVYSVLNTDTNEFQVTIDGVNAVNITDAGTGTHSYSNYSTNRLIPNFIVTKDQAVERGFWHESVLTGHREWATEGQHWELGFKSQLFKESTMATRRTTFDALFGYQYIDLYVARCNISGATSLIRDSSSAAVKFIMDKYETSFLTQANYEDIVTIGLRSKDYVDMSKTV